MYSSSAGLFPPTGLPSLRRRGPSLAVTYIPRLTGVFWKACTFLKGKERDLLGGSWKGELGGKEGRSGN